MQSITNNAITWAAFQLQGGWKNILLTASGYAIVVVGVVVTGAQFATVPIPSLMFNLLMALLAIQAAMLLLFAPSRIQTAVRRDIANGMIESHRLMPLSPTRAVFGYLLGPTIQPAALALATFVAGAFVAHAASVELPRWIVANVLLLEMATVAWIVMGAAAFSNGQGGFIAIMFILPGVLNTQALHVLPGGVLLIPPLVGKTVFEMRADLEPAHAVAFALHGVIAFIFLRAAARKYVRNDAPALTPLMGLGLIACWSAASIAAMRWWPQVQPAALRWSVNEIDGLTIVFTLAAGLLLALSPVTQSVSQSATGMRGQEPEARFASLAEPIAVALLAAVLAMLPAFFAPRELWILPRGEALTHTAVALVTVCLSVGLLAKALYLHHAKGWAMIVAWLMLTWLGPIAYDMVLHTLLDDGSDFVLGRISDLSPLGMLHAVWRRGVNPNGSAIAAQAGYVMLAAVILLVSYALRLRKRQNPPELSP